jgi:RimJ/RimL family protein N-acetyltransferase
MAIDYAIQRLHPVMLCRDRVDLVPMDLAHADALFDAGQDPATFQFWSVPMKTREDFHEFVRVALANRDKLGDIPWVVFDKEQKRIVGSTRLFDVQPQNRNAEIGHTWYDSAVWRTKVNTECKYLILKQCFEEWDLLRVQLKTCSRNVRSQEALARLGATREGVLRDHVIIHDGYVRSSVYFSVLAREWPDVKMRLEGFLEKHY